MSTAGWREVQAHHRGAVAGPRHRVQPEVALEVGEAQPGDVAGQLQLEGPQLLLAGLEPVDVVQVSEPTWIGTRSSHQAWFSSRQSAGSTAIGAAGQRPSLVRTWSTIWSSGTRSCSMVSRSRTVTAWSSTDSKSNVMHSGVPSSSWRR